jgi:iron-sulfur cluster repair protein YtfE (RIC family)
MKSMLSQQTPVRSLLKLRPLAIALLDKRKLRYWDALDKPLGDLFRKDWGRPADSGARTETVPRPEGGPRLEGMDDFLDEVSYTRVPAPDTDWSAMPLYMLIDYLTHDHRSLLLQEVADISHLLDVHTLSDDAEARLLRPFQRDFQAWVRDFQAHIEQEEGFLFPRVLRYEACLRDRNVHPEFHRGSIQSFMATREAQVGRQFYKTCETFAHRLVAHAAAHPASPAAEELAETASRLSAKLAAHFDLETKVLYVAARDLERSLYNMSIDGDPAVVMHRRGPMDSGIMRLEDA